jgi:PTS system nitrogen regulatory IIA component
VLFMSDMSEILAVEAINASLTVANKKALFQQLALAAARRTGLDTKLIVTALNERERLGSTGFGGGVAIPHGRSRA